MTFITGVVPHGRYKDRVVIEVDGAVWGVLSAAVVAGLGLAPGAPLDRDAWQRILAGAEADQAFDRALTYLERRSRSRAEVVRHLKDREFDGLAIDKALEKLERYRYIDDRNLAGAIVRDMVRLKGSGPRQIRQTLFRRGIGREDIDAALLELDEDSTRETAKGLLASLLRRYAGETDPRAKKRKIAAALMRRGYDWDTVSPLLSALDGGEEDC